MRLKERILSVMKFGKKELDLNIIPAKEVLVDRNESKVKELEKLEDQMEEKLIAKGFPKQETILDYNPMHNEKPANYNFRLVELYDYEYDNKEISEIIHKEYGILINEFIIKNKRTPEYIQNIKDQINTELHNKSKIIEDVVLMDNQSPKTLLEICNYLFEKYELRMTKNNVKEIINSNLSDIVFFNEEKGTYEVSRNFSEEKSGLNQYLKNLDGHYIFDEIQSAFKKMYLKIDTGYEDLNSIINTIVKDNEMTSCEEEFLKQKAIEMGLSTSLIDEAKNSLYSHNSYLDNIIHLIYDDGRITPEELKFLKDKTAEHDFSKTAVNKRFWVTGISVFLNHLLKIPGFDKIVKLWYLGKELDYEYIENDMWLFTKLNIFTGTSFEEVLNENLINIEKDIISFLDRKYTGSGRLIVQKAYEEIHIVDSNQENDLSLNHGIPSQDCLINITKMLNQEKTRIGSPDANLLVENIKFRIENNLWD